MLLRETFHNGALEFSRPGKRYVIARVRPIQHPRDDAVFSLIDRARRLFSAHRAIYRFYRQFSGMRWSECLPTADLAFTRLSGGEADVNRLLDGLINRTHWEIKQCANSRSLGGT